MGQIQRGNHRDTEAQRGRIERDDTSARRSPRFVARVALIIFNSSAFRHNFKNPLPLFLLLLLYASVSLWFTSSGAFADEPLDGREGRNLALDQFRPKPQLKVAEHLLPRAKFPVVDVHVHPRVRFRHSAEQLDDFVKLMDAQNIAVCVSLDGGLGDAFDEHARYLWTKYRDRFVIFANIDWQGGGRADDPASWDCQRPDFARRMAAELAAVKKKGASGLKVFKEFGLGYRNPDGSLVKIDDPRWIRSGRLAANWVCQ